MKTAVVVCVEDLRRFRPDLEARLQEEIPGRSSLISIERARSVLGYRPQYTLEAAVKS